MQHQQRTLVAIYVLLSLLVAGPVLSARRSQSPANQPSHSQTRPHPASRTSTRANSTPAALLSATVAAQTSDDSQPAVSFEPSAPIRPIMWKSAQKSGVSPSDRASSQQIDTTVSRGSSTYTLSDNQVQAGKLESGPSPAPNELVVKLSPQVTKKETSAEDSKPGFLSHMVSATKGLVHRALSWLGTRYVWGGSSRNGVDCSGLTRLLYESMGINLPHKARLQFHRGQAVARNELRPGDLVFFNTRGYVSHVGIYIGDGKFLHAANPRKGVRIDSLNSPYYNKRYVGARRYKDYSELG